MRVVIDTNVVISGALWPESLPGRALSLATRRCTVLQSVSTLKELYLVLQRPKFDRWVSLETRLEVFSTFSRIGEVVQDLPEVHACRDEKDNHLLSLAFGGRADYLVTGDEDLLSLGDFQGVRILTARQFMRVTADSSD